MQAQATYIKSFLFSKPANVPFMHSIQKEPDVHFFQVMGDQASHAFFISSYPTGNSGLKVRKIKTLPFLSSFPGKPQRKCFNKYDTFY
jgi:hypothetical protein